MPPAVLYPRMLFKRDASGAIIDSVVVKDAEARAAAEAEGWKADPLPGDVPAVPAGPTPAWPVSLLDKRPGAASILIDVCTDPAILRQWRSAEASVDPARSAVLDALDARLAALPQ